MKKLIVYIAVLVLLLPQMCFGTPDFESGDTGALGANQWRVRANGDLDGGASATITTGNIVVGGQTFTGTRTKYLQFYPGDFILDDQVLVTGS